MTRLLRTAQSRVQQLMQRKWARRVAWALAVYTVLGFLVVPAIVKWQMRKQLPSLTHRAARVDAVRINPYALSLTIRGFALTEPDGTTFASFSNLYVNFDAAASLVHRAWTFKQVRIGSPYAYLSVLTNGNFNFSNLLTNKAPESAPPAAPKPPPAVLVKALAITNGVVAVADYYRPSPFETKFAPIDVGLTNFATRPRAGSPYSFTASTGEGEYFTWAGTVRAVPAASAGRFELGGIDLKKYQTYLGEFARFDVRDGKVVVSAEYSAGLSMNGFELAISNGAVAVRNLAVFSPTNAPGEPGDALVSIPAARIEGAEASLQQRSIKVRAVETEQGTIRARRFSDGTLELLDLSRPPTNLPPTLLHPPAATAQAAPPTNSAPPSPWSVLIEKIEVKDYAVHVDDEQPPVPAHLVADQIGLRVEGLSLASNAPVRVEVAARVNTNGMTKLAATGTLLPLAIEADVDVATIDLRPLQPYVAEKRIKLGVQSGNVSVKGRASLAAAGTNPPAAKFAGEVEVNDLAVRDEIVFEDLIRWKQVAVRGIDVATSPMSLKVGELACHELVASVVVETNRQLTALAVLPAETNAASVSSAAEHPRAESSPKETATVLPFPVQLDLVALTNASIRFADLSIQPPCRFGVEQFSGTIRGLSSRPDSTADIAISGRVNETAPFSVAGRVNPLQRNLNADIVISNHNTELTAFTPYMEKFAGHPLQKGKLTVGLKYTIEDQALQARNIVFIDQLTLGPRNESPDATKLPVKLGVALLKDRNGRIELDVPVSGRLDDPKFKVVPVIWQVVLNLLAKAATSPFALLGAIVGGGEELSYIQFVPGQARMAEGELEKIEKLGKALYERPALNLEITGSSDRLLDPAALAWVALERELKTARMAELAGKSDAPPSLEEIRLEPREYIRLLRAAYKNAFNRERPLPSDMTNVPPAALAALNRREMRKGAEVQIARETTRPASVAQPTNAVSAAVEPRLATRPASFPALPEEDVYLAQMEIELFARAAPKPDDLRELRQSRAAVVQRALLNTGKVAGERLFILTPKPTDAATEGASRAILSLN